MTYIISSEEDLADELASRGVSPFTKVVDGEPSYFPCVFPLLIAAIVLIVYIAVFFDFYAVQLSRFTGNYAETEATVVSQSSHSRVHDHHRKRGHSTKSSTTHYTTYAVSDDGTEFIFKGTSDYGGKGFKIKVKYSKANPRHAYVDAPWSFSDLLGGFIMLGLFGAPIGVSYLGFRWNRKCREIAEGDLYLPVRETSRYEVRTVRHKHSRPHKQYAPVYRYAMPDGPDLLFQGMWTREMPEGEPANDYKDFRVYMMEPENPDNNTYFIKSIPR
ncbi:DUF3592 domain-containing protein [Succinimonas sp.]|uniref:DUF3592 domain-containing protein n=1 Tax=Succinimonas sp. TaxID=1936151 RepID=UPI0038681C0D